MKEAMKARDKVRLAALRDIKSKIMLAMTESAGAEALNDTAVTKILSKQLKQREDTMVIYKDQGRDDLVAEEEAQAEVIRVYLPQPMTRCRVVRSSDSFDRRNGRHLHGRYGQGHGRSLRKICWKGRWKAISALVRSNLG